MMFSCSNHDFLQSHKVYIKITSVLGRGGMKGAEWQNWNKRNRRWMRKCGGYLSPVETGWIDTCYKSAEWSLFNVRFCPIVSTIRCDLYGGLLQELIWLQNLQHFFVIYIYMEKCSQTLTATLNSSQWSLLSLNAIIFISSINVVIYTSSLEQE